MKNILLFGKNNHPYVFHNSASPSLFTSSHYKIIE